MNSVELEIDEQAHVGAMFVSQIAREIRRALITEKKSRKVTQQAIADRIGTSRAVVNREISGVENLTAKRIAELLWALGWEPHFEARKPKTNKVRNPKVEPSTDENYRRGGKPNVAPKTASNTNELLVAAE